MRTDGGHGSRNDAAAFPPIRRWVIRLASIAVGVVLALALCEAAVRVFGVGPDVYPLIYGVVTLSDNPKLLYELVPGVVADHGDVVINSDGMRDRDRPVAKARSTFRIACVGDSICFGMGVGQLGTFPRRLEVLLNRCFATEGRRFEVLNFGLTGYNITQNVENLRVRALKYDPDLILFVYCLNDPEDFSFQYAALRAQLTAADKHYRDRLIQRGRRLLLRSRLLLLAQHSIESMREAGRQLQGERPAEEWLRARESSHTGWVLRLHRGETWRRTVEQFDRLAEIVHAGGIETQVVIFPFFIELDAYALGSVHELVTDASRERGLGVIDLLRDFQTLDRASNRPYSIDIAHPNERGNEFAAVAILRQLVGRGLIPNAPDGVGCLVASPGPAGGMARLLENQVGEGDGS